MTDKLDKFMGFDRALSVTGARAAGGAHQGILREMEEAMTAPAGGHVEEDAELDEGWKRAQDRKARAGQRGDMLALGGHRRLTKNKKNATSDRSRTRRRDMTAKEKDDVRKEGRGRVHGDGDEAGERVRRGARHESLTAGDAMHLFLLDEGKGGLSRNQKRTVVSQEDERRLTTWLERHPEWFDGKRVEMPRKIKKIMSRVVGKVVTIKKATPRPDLKYRAKGADEEAQMDEGGAYGRDVGPAVSHSGEGQYKRSDNAGAGPYGRKKRRPGRERVQNRPWPDFQGQGMERGEDVDAWDGDEVDEEARAFLEPSVVASDNANAARFVYRDSYITKPRRKTPMFRNEAWDGGVFHEEDETDDEADGGGADVGGGKGVSGEAMAALAAQLKSSKLKPKEMVDAMIKTGDPASVSKTDKAVLALLISKGVTMAKKLPQATLSALGPAVKAAQAVAVVTHDYGDAAGAES